MDSRVGWICLNPPFRLNRQQDEYRGHIEKNENWKNGFTAEQDLIEMADHGRRGKRWVSENPPYYGHNLKFKI
jgi:hypothetical protein